MENAEFATFEHLAKLLQFPAIAAQRQNQTDFDRERLKRVERSLLFRPQFLPVQHALPMAVQAAPISETTGDDIDYPTIITGAITDGESRNCRLYRNSSPKSLINYGDESTLKLSLDAIAGHSVATAGFAGVRDFPTPYRLNEAEYLTLEIFQENAAAAGVETVTTCFNGVRVFTPQHADAQLSPANRQAVLNAIASRPSPETKFAICKVTFDAAGAAMTRTPLDDEPMFILGHRSTFTDAMVSVGYTDNFGFSEDPFPIWALCSEVGNTRDIWNMLKVPLFVPPRRQLRYTLDNTIDTTSGLVATNGNIEVLLGTM